MAARAVLCSATAFLVFLTGVSPGSAGGRPVACYERTPPVYETVRETVVVRPAARQVQYVPPVYGWRRRAVMVTPHRISYEVVPAVVQTRYRSVKVAGGYSWEWRWIGGRKVLCKVRSAPRLQTVAETVVVRPEYRRRIVYPAEYAYQIEQVILQPASGRAVEVPAAYRTVTRQVLVGGGESGWRRVNIGRICG